MGTFTPPDSEIFVYTYREGVLAAVAHDLRLRFAKFSIHEQEADHGLVATIDAASLKVVCARQNGQDAPQVLTDSNKHDIEKNIQTSVLRGAKHPTISVSLTARELGACIASVELCGVRRDVPVQLSLDGTTRVARARLHQPDFGIKPYSAMLGALRLRPEVDIEVRLPA